MTDAPPAGGRTPADFLKAIKGKPVVVKLNNGTDYRGEREEEGGVFERVKAGRGVAGGGGGGEGGASVFAPPFGRVCARRAFPRVGTVAVSSAHARSHIPCVVCAP